MKITLEDNKFTCEPAMTSIELTNTVLGIAMATMKEDILKAPDDKKDALTAYLYDTFNLMASEFLKELAPDYDMRPDITEQAILKAQDEILENECEDCKIHLVKEGE